MKKIIKIFPLSFLNLFIWLIILILAFINENEAIHYDSGSIRSVILILSILWIGVWRIFYDSSLGIEFESELIVVFISSVIFLLLLDLLIFYLREKLKSCFRDC